MQPVQRQPFLLLATPLRVEQSRHLSRQAACRADQPLGVGCQIVGVDARLVVIAVQLGVGADLEQIAIPGLVLRQQQQVVAFLVVYGVAAGHRPSPAGQIGFDTDHRVDAGGAAGAEEGNHPVHCPVVGQRQRGLAQRLGALYQLVDPAQAVEQRELGVYVKMNKIV